MALIIAGLLVIDGRILTLGLIVAYDDGTPTRGLNGTRDD